MAGLMGMARQQPQPEQAGSMTGGPASPQVPGDGNLPPEVAEQVKAAEQFVFQKAYSDRVFGNLIKQVDEGNGTQALSSTVVLLLDAAEARMGEMPLEVLLALAIVLVRHVGKGIGDSGREFGDTEIDQSLQLAIQSWLSSHEHRADPEAMMGAMDASESMLGAQEVMQ